MVTTSRPRVTSLLALLCAVVLLAGACGDDDSSGDAATDTTAAEGGDATTTTVAAAEPASDFPAAGVRSDLTALLEEQVYLTGLLVETAVAEGDGAEGPAAVAVAEQGAASATELSEIVGAAYGTAAGVDFLEAWNAHRQALSDYALAGGTAEAVDTARDQVTTVLGEIDPEADFAEVAAGLESSDAELLTTLDELVAGTPAAAVDLRAAAEEMPETALALAEVIVAHSELEGEVDGEESALRAELTGLIQESALLSGLAMAETVEAGGDPTAPGPTGVRAALDETTDALAQAMEPDDALAATQFGQIWDAQIQAYADYTQAVVADDAAGTAAAEEAIVAFRDDLGELLAERYSGLTKEGVAEELVPLTDALLAYADALDAEATGAETIESPAVLREAALAARLAARTLTRGITSAPVE